MNHSARLLTVALAAALSVAAVARGGSIWAKTKRHKKAPYSDDTARKVGDTLTIIIDERSVIENETSRSLKKDTSRGAETGGTLDPANVIGPVGKHVFDFPKLNLSSKSSTKFDGSANTIDAAIALSSMDALGNATPVDGYGTPKSATTGAAIGQKVQKYGRSTGLTKGTVNGIHATVWVGYGTRTALFVDQIIVQASKPFVKPGDSGSLVVTSDRIPVGLIFAGNGSGKLAVADPIDAVLTQLGVTVDGE